MAQPPVITGRKTQFAEGTLDPSTTGKTKMTKSKRVRSRSSHKVRVHLPSIESYQKELEFPAEGPGRVIVRLERLMGTDRVRITDTKYMSTLLDRLEEQEKSAWTKRRLGRIKTERNRFRQLAIDGLMEPGPDMQDLHTHPVFRVNRVLNRLSKMDTNISTVPNDRLPPIDPVDPFLNDPNGREFQKYPGHRYVNIEELSEMPSVKTSVFGDDEEESEEMEELPPSASSPSAVTLTGMDVEYLKNPKPPSTTASPKKAKIKSSRPVSKESGREWTQKVMSRKSVYRIQNTRPSQVEEISLTEVQQQYGVSPSQDLRREWEPFRSHLINMVFNDDGQQLHELYQLAEDVLGVYKREQETADDYVNKINRLH